MNIEFKGSNNCNGQEKIIEFDGKYIKMAGWGEIDTNRYNY